MIKVYRHLYKPMKMESLDGVQCGVVWIPSELNGKPWYDHLVPSHRKFFDSLDPAAQIMCSLSCDPFNELKSIWERKR